MATTDILTVVARGVFLGAMAWVSLFFAGALTWMGHRSTRTAWVAADLIGETMLLVFASEALWRVSVSRRLAGLCAS